MNKYGTYHESTTFGTDIEFRIIYTSYIMKTIRLLFLQFLFTLFSMMIVVFSQTVAFHLIQNIYFYMLTGIFGGMSTILHMMNSTELSELQIGIFTLFQTMIVCGISAIYTNQIFLITFYAFAGIAIGILICGYSPHIKYTEYSSFLYSAMSTLFTIGILNIFYNSNELYLIELHLGAFLMFCHRVVNIHIFLIEQSLKNASIQPDLHIVAVMNIFIRPMITFFTLIETINHSLF